MNVTGGGLGSRPTAQEAEYQRRIEKLAKINAALMQRVERSMDQQANAYSLFQSAIGLEAQVGLRTEELKGALARLERSNGELVVARDSAERADRLKTRFFTAVGHDLLQPLHAARLSLSALSEGADPAESGRIAAQIEHALSSVEEMLKTILDISRLEAGMMRPSPQQVAVRDLFQSLALDMQSLARVKSLTLTFRAGDVAVLSDPLMLKRVLQNLLANAVRYADRGGVMLAARLRGSHVRLEVWDTGPGILPAEQARIFEEFQRGSAAERPGHGRGGGFGLGLSIVQRMAEALGHPLDLCSRPGHGSRFAVTVPYAGPASAVEAPPKAAAISQAYGLAAARVVVIDNDFAVLEAMRTLLGRWGCEVHLAGTLQDVEDIIEQAVRPDIVLADYHLEHGEIGLDAVARLRAAIRPDLPAVVITADHTAELVETVRAAGCEIFRKPVKPAELRALMQHLLG